MCMGNLFHTREFLTEVDHVLSLRRNRSANISLDSAAGAGGRLEDFRSFSPCYHGHRRRAPGLTYVDDNIRRNTDHVPRGGRTHLGSRENKSRLLLQLFSPRTRHQLQ